MRPLRPPPSPPCPPWWVDLVHPVPLGAAAILFLNDHALKGASLLPGWLTGKLSDVTGLFVFPIVLVACLRWAAAAAGRDVPRSRALVWGAAAVTGALFAAVKLSPGVNRWASALLGPMVMDPWDLAALVALVPAGAWMSRRTAAGALRGGTPALRTAAAAFAGLACVATSKVEEIPPGLLHGGPGAPVPVVAACAHLAPVTCRYDATRVVVRLSVKRHDSSACAVQIAALGTRGPEGAVSVALQSGGSVELGDPDAALIGAWGRPAKAGVAWESATAVVTQWGQGPEGPTRHRGSVAVECRPGFGDDTQPPAEVAR